MEKSSDVFAWTRKLGCPPAICNNSVKKALYTGLAAFVWDELSEVIYPADEAKTIHKNILLHHLKHGTPDKIIECIKKISQIKSDRKNLQNQITKLEEEYEQLDFKVRQKAKKLQDIRSKRAEARAKKDLFKLKHDQTATQLRDCNDMKLVCQHLMPSTGKDLDPKVLMEVFDVVTSLWAGAGKKEVWNTVSSNLDHIEVPTLWHHLYENLTQDVDLLIQYTSTKPIDTNKKDINIGIAKIHGQHISMVSKQLLYNAEAKEHQQNVLEFIEKFEMASNSSEDISEWLALALEVCKLESEEKTLHEEINKIRGSLCRSDILKAEISEITSEIQNVNEERMECVQEIQQSLSLLKSAPTFLMNVNKKINLELEKIVAIRNNDYDLSVLDNDLTTELDIFHEGFDLNALRKVMLKGDVGIYRYTKSCLSEASISVTTPQLSNIMTHFPTLQIPIYTLLDCYKNLVSMLIYGRFENLEIEEEPEPLQLPTLINRENNYNTVELLNLSKVYNTKTKAEIEEFNEIMNAWRNQTVEKVMEIVDKTVDDATFSQWIKRYDLVLYMLQCPT
nr:PREDICTED: uncharacterized protein LOC100883207 [Megachile rotundata]